MQVEVANLDHVEAEIAWYDEVEINTTTKVVSIVIMKKTLPNNTGSEAQNPPKYGPSGSNWEAVAPTR